MKLGAVVLFTLLAGDGCRHTGPVTPQQGPCPCLGQEFSVPVGGSVSIDSEQLEVLFEKVESDSRCPAGVKCVWEGDAAIEVRLAKRSQEPGQVELHTSRRFASERPYLEYRVRLVALAPQLRTETPVDPASYRATLLVSKN